MGAGISATKMTLRSTHARAGTRNCHAMKNVLLGVMLLLSCGSVVSAADRISVALLKPRNESGDTKCDYWQSGIYLLLGYELFQPKSIRLFPETSVDYAAEQLELKPDRPLEARQARKLGEMIEARRIIWSEYRQDGAKYSLTLRVMNTATGKVSRKLTASGPDWFQVVSNCVNGALHELAVVPTPEEQNRMDRLPTRSTEALEFYARGVAVNRAAKPLSESEPLFRKAASIDPAFSAPLAASAFCTTAMGPDGANEAEETARRAVKISPDYPASHFVLGMILEFEGMNHGARDELLEAVRLNPDDSRNYERLGEIYSRMDKTEDAMSAWKQAALLAPYDPMPHADLGAAYAIQGNRAKALEELRIAEHFNPVDELQLDQALADAYQKLNDVPHYVEHAEKFIAAAKKAGAQNQIFKDAETELELWKQRLNPHFITASAPRDYSAEELDGALKARLTPAEFQSIANPLNSTLEMKQWARELTAGATGEQEKASRLFEGLTHHLDRGNPGGKRTAEQVFAIWKETNVDLTCLDYAFLYVALARDAGLSSYFTVIKRDCYGNLVMHVCACVFIDGKALLADPAYDWFGAPHQEYDLQDDFQAIGDFLCQLQDLESQRLAVKLRPDFALGHFNYAMTLAGLKQLKEARKELAAGLALDSGSPMALLAQGAVEANEQHLVAAAQHLQQCLDIEPGVDDARYALAVVLDAQGKSSEAREQFRKYLQGRTEPKKADLAIEAIARINEELADANPQTPPASQPGLDAR
jgi:tetratricopeptide (TPR) repeat protein